jgi:hypothetical protein
MAGNRLERRTQPVRLGFVIAADDGNFSPVLQPDLGRSGDVACRMQGKSDPVDRHGFPIRKGIQFDLAAQAVFEYLPGLVLRQVAGHSPAGMVRMGMGNHRISYGFPGIDVQVGLGAINTLVVKRYQLLI